jgi:hypothetical protein
MEQGLSYESFSATIGTHRDTLYAWEKVHPEFSDAKKIGRELSLLWYERIGNQATQGEVPNFNATAWVFSLKNKHQYRDKTPEEVREESRPLIIVKPSTGEREILTNTRAVEQLDVGKSEEDEE